MAVKSLKITGSGQTMIGGIDYGSFSLISGMDKAGSLLYNTRPFGQYYLRAADALLKTKLLMVIGYGGRDLYLNALIAEHSGIHGESRRAVAILPYDSKWQSEPRRGENILLRLLVGRERWDKSHGLAGGSCRSDVVDAGPLKLYTLGVPGGYAQASAICDYLDAN